MARVYPQGDHRRVVAFEQTFSISRWIFEQLRRTQIITDAVKVELPPLATTNDGSR